jgi:hypothetical protein
MKSASSQNGIDQPQPVKNPIAIESTTAAARNGQPSRATIGCG